jgi:hypothetical protein
MELLDRYLQAVRFWLPKTQQDDMITELGDDLRSQIEDKESAQGRPLTEDELVALLQHTGHPLKVAARYQPQQQALIGPMLFPIYKFILKMIGLFYMLPSFLVWIALVLFVPQYHAENAFLAALRGYAGMWTNAFLIFAIITLIFAGVERFQGKIAALQQWDPRKLPAASTRKERISRVQTVSELTFSILFIWGWLALPGIAHAMFAPAEKILTLSPALIPYYWLCLLPMSVNVVQQAINLFRPQWTWLRPPMQLLSTAMTTVIVLFMMRLYPYFTVASSAADDTKHAAGYANLALNVNQILQWSLIIFAFSLGAAMIVFSYQTVKAIRKHVGGPRNQAAMQISQSL